MTGVVSLAARAADPPAMTVSARMETTTSRNLVFMIQLIVSSRHSMGPFEAGGET